MVFFKFTAFLIVAVWVTSRSGWPTGMWLGGGYIAGGTRGPPANCGAWSTVHFDSHVTVVGIYILLADCAKIARRKVHELTIQNRVEVPVEDKGGAHMAAAQVQSIGLDRSSDAQGSAHHGCGMVLPVNSEMLACTKKDKIIA